MDENLDLDIVASSEQADAALSKLETLLERIDKSLGNVTASLDAFTGKIEGIAKGIDKVSSHAGKARKSLSDMGKIATPDPRKFAVVNGEVSAKKQIAKLSAEADKIRELQGAYRALRKIRADAIPALPAHQPQIIIADGSAGSGKTDADLNWHRSTTWDKSAPGSASEATKEQTRAETEAARAAAERLAEETAVKAALAEQNKVLSRALGVINRMRRVTSRGGVISVADVDRVNDLIASAEQVGPEMDVATAAIQNVKTQLAEMQSASAHNKRFADITKQMQALEKQIDKTRARYDTLARAEQAAYKNGRSVSGIQERMHQVRESLGSLTREYDILALRQRELESGGGTGMNRAAAAIYRAAQNAKALEAGFHRAGAAAWRFLGKVTPIPALFRRIEGAGRKLWRLLQYRLLRTFIADLVKDLGTAMKYMAKADPEFNRTASSIVDGMNGIKAAIASAFAPLIQAIGPAVISVLNKIATAVHSIGMAIAAMTGKETYTRLTAGATDLASELDDVSKKGKKAEDTLAGFDTFNLLGNENKSGSGSDSGLSYEAEKIDITGMRWYDDLRNLGAEIARGFKNVKSIIKDALSPILTDLGINPDNILQGVTKTLGDINGFLERNAPSISSIINGIIEILGRLGKAAFEAGWELIKWVFGIVPDATTEQALATIADKLKAVNDWLGKNHDLVVSIIKVAMVATVVIPILTAIVKAVSTIITVGKALFDVIKGIAAFITGHAIVAVVALIAVIAIFGDKIQAVLQRVDDFLQGVFMADMRNIFGPGIGDVLNGCLATFKGLWGGIKQTLDGIIDLIRGVFTGDWKRAWTGVVEIFSGVFGTLSSLAKAPINAVISIINGALNLINMVTDKVNSISIDIPEFLGGGKLGFNIPRIPNIAYLSGGGMVNAGQLFVANERGPEMVGRIGNQSAVANQGQMTEALSSGVYNGFIRAIQSLGGSLGGGDINLNVELDGEPVYRNVVRRNRSQTRQTGRNPLMT